jgi:EAL domain-containing protein (putative c-di-GMP-specific phosphodiesterase class I)
VLEPELRRALDRGEFRLRFQGVVRPSTGRIVGAEALLRWEHPTRGLLTPDAFLGPAERCGLLDAVGEWVIAQAIAERATWPAGTFISLNLSPSEFASATRRDLVGQIARACRTNGVSPSDVWVEVTEQPIIALGPTIATLHSLRDLGVTVALDDFGSGSASLARLRELPFDVCKLDRSFVTNLEDEAGSAILRSVLDMVRAFGMQAVAEGVENAVQLGQLDDLSCDLVQGYHLTVPVPSCELRGSLEAQDHVGAGRLEPTGAVSCGPTERDHRVLYYDADETLVRWVADGLAPVLAAGDSAATVATAEHNRSLLDALGARGVDVAAAVVSGQLVQLDAADTLDLITDDGVLVTERVGVLGSQLLPTDPRRQLAVYGEMATLLWQRGDVAGAMALEDTWNRLLDVRPLTLLCAYPCADLAVASDGGALEQVGRCHSSVEARLEPGSPATPTTEGVSPRELQELRARLEASERFGAMAVHEMRNPIAVLTLALDTLRGSPGPVPSTESGHLLEMAATSARRVEALAADLLSAAKLQRAEFTVRHERFDLGLTVSTAVEHARLTSGREVGWAAPAEPTLALGDDERERQVLANLLDNALASTPGGEPVVVSCVSEPDRLVVRVADAGPGIGVEDRHRLFDPFTQLVDAGRATGTGLGLHIVQELVRAQGGTVWVEDNPGGGAVFCHTVPRVTAPVGDLLRPLESVAPDRSES